jgi:hypothetical protein
LYKCKCVLWQGQTDFSAAPDGSNAMTADSIDARRWQFPRFGAPVAATVAGLLGGIVYLAAQACAAALNPATTAWVPLERISAILLGPGAAPPSLDAPVATVGFAFLIHAALCVVYGRMIGLMVLRLDLPRAGLTGALVGLALFGLNLFVIAPSAFPWFDYARTISTGVDHVLFGVVVAIGCVLLRRGDGADTPWGAGRSA